MSTDEVIEAVMAWARATVPDLKGGYPYAPTSKTEELPDVVVDANLVETALDSPEFPYQQLQQHWIFIYRMELSFMVDNTDPHVAAQQLRQFEALLRASLLDDGTLGGRVPFISPLFAFDYTPPFVEYPDGTRGREMTLTMAVGEPVEVE